MGGVVGMDWWVDWCVEGGWGDLVGGFGGWSDDCGMAMVEWWVKWLW